MMEIFLMDFMQRAWLAGLIMAVICPLIGSFLVLRHQSMIGDGLGHIAFAGVAGGGFIRDTACSFRGGGYCNRRSFN